MPKSAQDLINQYREVLNPNKNQVEYRRLPESKKVNENLPDQLTRLSQSLAVALQNVNIPGDFRARLADQQQALETLTSQIVSDQPDMNEIENALNTLGGLGDLLAESHGPDGRTVYDDVVSTNQSMGLGQDRLDDNLNVLSTNLHLGIDTQRLHDHQPMVHEVWENEAISTGWSLRKFYNYQEMIPNNPNSQSYQNFMSDDNNYIGEFDQADYGLNGMKVGGEVSFVGQFDSDTATGEVKMASREKVAEGRNLQRAMSRDLLREQNRRSDERTKRYYGDLAYLTNPDNGNYMEAAYRTPYVTSLMNMSRTVAQPSATGSVMQKMDLGVPLYEASYDLFHSATEEVRVQYNRQRLEKQLGGWTQEKENEYLRDLKAAHENVIRNFDNFAQFDGRTDGSLTRHFLDKDLNQTVAKRLSGAHRYKDATVGELRGEVQAMNNGWSSNELPVLGMIGAIDASLKVYEKFGSPQQAAGVMAFRDDLEKLKEECFHTKVTTAESKRLIANRVKQFMDSHQENELQQEIMTPVKEMMGAFNKAHSEITTAAAKELHDPNLDVLKDTDPAAYLRDLEQKAVRSGNFSVYAAEVADMFAGKDNLPQDQQQALDQYWGTIQQKAETDPGFIRNFADAMAQNQVKAGAALEQAKQEMAGAIRDGREPVDPMLGDVRHIPEAARLIAGQKLESSEMARQLSSAKNMTARMDGLFAAAPLANYAEYVTNAEKAYANDRTDGLSAQEKNLYLNLSKEEPGQGLQQFGVQQTKDPQTGAYTVTQAPTKQQVLNELQSVSAAIGTGMVNGNDYRSKLRGLHNQVSSQNGLLQRLETLQADRSTGKYMDNGQFVDAQTERPIKRSDANSGAFMNMVDALKKVNALSAADSTPLQVSQAMENLDKAAEAYQQKIASQGIFGAWTRKGQKRVELAGELREFVREQRNQFNVYANSTALAPNEKIGEQYTKINLAIDNLNRDIQVQNQNQVNQANNGQPVAQNPEQVNNAQQPAQPKKGGVKEFATLDDFMQSLNTKQRPHLEEPAAKGQQRQRSSSIHRKQPENKPDMNPNLP